MELSVILKHGFLHICQLMKKIYKISHFNINFLKYLTLIIIINNNLHNFLKIFYNLFIIQ